MKCKYSPVSFLFILSSCTKYLSPAIRRRFREVLLEPAEKAWCANWRRDWAHHLPHPDWELFFKTARAKGGFNQFNAALHDDRSL